MKWVQKIAMALFQFKALRKFLRSHMRPIREGDAATWKKRLSLGYMLVAWNAFGFVLYMIWKGKSDWAVAMKNDEELRLTPAQQWSKTLGIKDAQVYRISGLKVSSYEIHNDFDNKEAKEDEKPESVTPSDENSSVV